MAIRYEAYLEKHPNGEFVPLAKVRLEELRAPDRVTHQGPQSPSRLAR